VINMATKSGTNSYHGTGYEYFRNTVLNANDFFAKRNDTGKQPFHQNQFGANIGGPIKRDKMFIFGDTRDTGRLRARSTSTTCPHCP